MLCYHLRQVEQWDNNEKIRDTSRDACNPEQVRPLVGLVFSCQSPRVGLGTGCSASFGAQANILRAASSGLVQDRQGARGKRGTGPFPDASNASLAGSRLVQPLKAGGSFGPDDEWGCKLTCHAFALLCVAAIISQLDVGRAPCVLPEGRAQAFPGGLTSGVSVSSNACRPYCCRDRPGGVG